MELTEHRCPRCGAELGKTGGSSWKCKYCGGIFDDTTAEKNAKQMQDMFDEAKRERINNIRRVLYDATTAEFISSNDIKNACDELKKYLPDDFRANFYEIAVGNNLKKLTSAIRKIDVEQNYDEIENIVIFLIKSLQPEYLLELNNLVERAFKGRDLQKFEKYATEISVQAEKVQAGVYETKLPREVFVAYSSKDMEKVSELVEVLESQNIKCFVAARNLRHGRGSVENYDKALKDAMDHCKSFVFVSSMNSRSLSCDALEIEIPYIQKQDIENAPSEYRNNYTAIPHKYKKPRVEYRIESSKGFNAADQITGEFFDGYEWVLSPDEVAVRVLKQLVATPVDKSAPATTPLLKRMFIFLEEGDWTKANEYCERVLDQDPESANAYLGKLMIDLHIRVKEKLSTCEEPFDNNNNYKRAIRYGDEKLIPFLQNQANAVRLREERRKAEEARRLREAEERRKAEEARKLREAEERSKIEVSSVKSTGYDVWLINPGSSKLSVIKIIRETACLGLKESNELTQNLPSVILKGITIDRANRIKAMLEDAGATVEIRGVTADQNQAEEVRKLRKLEHDTSLKIDPEVIKKLNELKKINEEKIKLAESLGLYQSFPESHVSDEITESETNKSTIDNDFDIENGILRKYKGKGGNVIIPNSVTRIGYNAFEGCTSLTSIDIPDSVTSIGAGAFKDCTGLTSVTIPESVTSIDSMTNLTSDTIPGSATSIVGKLQKITNVLDKLYIAGAFEGCTSLMSITIGNGVTSIGKNAFKDCTSLTCIVIPNSVTSIGKNAFKDCTSLTSIVIPNSVTSIGENAFKGCTSLTSIVIPNSVTSIGEGAFSGCANLKSITLPFIGGSATGTTPRSYPLFGYIFGKDSYTGGVEAKQSYELEDETYYIPSALKEVTVTGEKIPYYAFSGCTSLTSIVIPDSVTSIGENAFKGCTSLTSIVIPNSVTSIGWCAFLKCTNLTSVTIPNSVTSIGSFAFENCTSLTSVTIPNSVTSIGDGAFSGCANLTGITLPFVGDSTTGVIDYIPSSVKNVTITGGKIPDSAFKNCKNLTSITIVNGVTSIGNCAFEGCTGLTSIVIPDSVTSIDVDTFRGCKSLTSIDIPDSVTSIGYNAFDGCTSLTSIVIPDSVTSIGDYAFENCTSLTSVTIGNGVTSIGYSAFENCASLTSVTFKKSNDWRYLKWFLIGDFEIRISRRKLANDLTAAKYLRKKCREYKWKCRK